MMNESFPTEETKSGERVERKLSECNFHKQRHLFEFSVSYLNVCLTVSDRKFSLAIP